MRDNYILWSSRLNGWLTTQSTYSTDQAEARKFSRDSALQMVRKHRREGGYTLLPVSLEDLQDAA